jgi:hypothetical protein
MESIRDKLPGKYRRFEFKANEETPEFEESQKSTKVPDLWLSYWEDGPDSVPRIIFITEVGFREKYEDLKQSMVLWLEGNPDVKMAFLVKFKESPQYRSPVDAANLPEALLKDVPLPIHEIRPKIEEGIGKQQGSLLIHGIKFAGEMTGFLEIWHRDSRTGKATQLGKQIVSTI